MISVNYSARQLPRFWENIQRFGDDVAIVDCRKLQAISYRQIAAEIASNSAIVHRTTKGLACLAIRNDLESILCYLTLLTSGYAIYLCEGANDTSPSIEFISQYRPDLILWGKDVNRPQCSGPHYRPRPSFLNFNVAERNEQQGCINPDLALLLSTSGSSGSSRVARLSYNNIASNAQQIMESLDINSNERAVLSLPLHYVYGLSVLHSFLNAGASLVVGAGSVMDRKFWSGCRATGVTMLPAVPTMLDFMRDIAADSISMPRLNKATISGAPMSRSTRDWVSSHLVAKGLRVYSMYGMTEASGRIAVLPHDEFVTRPASVGRVVAGGRLQLSESGEIFFSGPNVMLGYADCRSDLSRADDLRGILATGDLGAIDSDGYLSITGRIARICKILGTRISLDAVEEYLSADSELAVTSDDRIIAVFHTENDESDVVARTVHLAERIQIPHYVFELRRLRSLPRTSTGKVDYPRLLACECVTALQKGAGG